MYGGRSWVFDLVSNRSADGARRRRCRSNRCGMSSAASFMSPAPTWHPRAAILTACLKASPSSLSTQRWCALTDGRCRRESPRTTCPSVALCLTVCAADRRAATPVVPRPRAQASSVAAKMARCVDYCVELRGADAEGLSVSQTERRVLPESTSQCGGVCRPFYCSELIDV